MAFDLLSSNVHPRFLLNGGQARITANASASATESGAVTGLTERKVKVDPDVAYESKLCTRCSPTKPSPWETGALLYMQIGFGLVLALIMILMLVAIYLCADYVAKHGSHCKPKNRRRLPNC